MEPLLVGLFREHFKLIFFPSETIFKRQHSSLQMRLAEILERKGWEGLPAHSCLGGVPSLNSLRGTPLFPLAISEVWGIIKEQMRI